MTTSFHILHFAKTAPQVGAGFGVRTGRLSSPVAIAMAGGAAISHDVRMADGNLDALAARCAG
jgi:hypothetical protein